MSIKDRILKKGIMIKFTFGKIFNPYYQKRTSAMDDLVKKGSKKTDKQLDEAFGIERKGE